MEVKTTSSSYLIQRLFANHSISNSAWLNDARDWIPQAMRFIGKHAGFEVNLCTNVFVENYRTCYPAYMEGLLAVLHNGLLLQLGSNLAGVPINKDNTQVKGNLASNEDILEINKLKQLSQTLIDDYATTPTLELETKINEVAAKIDAKEKFISIQTQWNVNRVRKVGEFYNTKLEYIQTSFETGYIDILYCAFPVDDNGFVKVIDDEYYIQAIEWYVMLMLIQKGYKHPIFDYQWAYSMFWGGNKLEPLGWRAKAANHVRIPSFQEAERFTRMWEQAKFRRDLPMQLFQRTEQATGFIY